LTDALESRGTALPGANVIAVGVTYKPDVADVRESAAVAVIDAAMARGARVHFHDPLVPVVSFALGAQRSVRLADKVLAAADAVLLLTPHATIDYDRIIARSRLVVDTHGGLCPRTGHNVWNAWLPAAARADVLALV
jgi:UDP-N-acetyl-D-glucosamine dehydrogenase